MMDAVRAEGMPLKNGISTADLLGAEFAVLAVIAALRERDRSGRGQLIDLSMQDIAAWLTQSAWNEPVDTPPVAVIACSEGYVVAEMEGPAAAEPSADQGGSYLSRDQLVTNLEARGIRAAPVLSIHEATEAPETAARRLWFSVTEGDVSWPLLASPLRLTLTPPAVRHPMPALGWDNEAIRASVAKPALTDS
jgi:crotonobetainyl-CoA:carnitine CoA-transferase CaiB-like acyl-CoA transferase